MLIHTYTLLKDVKIFDLGGYKRKGKADTLDKQ